LSDYRKYLEPQTAAKIKNFELRAKLVVEGFITGLHRSPYHGFSVEFAEHRQYRAGDELRHIDWQVYGRTNRYYVKQFEEETNLRCTIAVDCSASMKFASKNHISKFEYACYLASSLAYLMMKQKDAVGLSLYDAEVKKYMPPLSKMSYIGEIMKTLDKAELSGSSNSAMALSELADRVKSRGLVIVISDFFDDVNDILKALKKFRHNNHEIIAFQLLDPRELDFKLGQSANFIDLETGEQMQTNPYQIERDYAAAMESFIHEFKKGCSNNKIDYHLITTEMPFDKALRDYLAKRQKM